MSEIIWTNSIVPGEDVAVEDRTYPIYASDFRVPNTLSFPKIDEEIVELPDRRTYRSLSRAGILLAAAGLKAQSVLAPLLQRDAFRVGIYCAMENGPTDYHCAKEMVSTPSQEFAATYKSLRSAKQYLRQLPNLAPAQLAIFLNIMGPLIVYNHSSTGSLHALEQAEFDLQLKTVDAALVCSAFSLEDALLSFRTRRDTPASTVLSEGAGAIILRSNDTVTDWQQTEFSDTSCSYGIASPIVTLSQRRQKHDQ